MVEEELGGDLCLTLSYFRDSLFLLKITLLT
jgi:hypothetical protein